VPVPNYAPSGEKISLILHHKIFTSKNFICLYNICTLYIHAKHKEILIMWCSFSYKKANQYLKVYIYDQ
jgi:hypothetical protein